MTHRIHFITYGNEIYNNSKKRLEKQAINCKWFDTVTICGPNNLSEHFRREFMDILNKPRGAGYWIWKFDIIKQHLIKLNRNDILIYADAGCSINIQGKARFYEYIDMLNDADEDIISFQMLHAEKKYTIKQLFHCLNMDTNDHSGQYSATVLIMKCTDKMIKMIDECINVLRIDPLLVTDYYNQLGQNSFFIDNRHDQSILSLVRKKLGSIVLPDETYFFSFGDAVSLRFPFWATRKK